MSSLFVCPQVQINDKALYDHSSHSWTVDKYLDDLEERYGGIDCVLLWHSYTNLGADPRNQMDLLRVVPGGVEQLQNVSAQFNAQARDVYALFGSYDHALQIPPAYQVPTPFGTNVGPVNPAFFAVVRL